MKWAVPLSQSVLLLVAISLIEKVIGSGIRAVALSDLLIIAACLLSFNPYIVAAMVASIFISPLHDVYDPMIYHMALSVPYVISGYFVKRQSFALSIAVYCMALFQFACAFESLFDPTIIWIYYGQIVISIHAVILGVSSGVLDRVIVFLGRFRGDGHHQGFQVRATQNRKGAKQS